MMKQETIEGFRLSPQQRRLWSLQDGGTAFHAQIALQIEGELRRAALKDAVRSLVENHEILRTTFPLLPGMKFPVQVVNDHGTHCWRELDFTGLGQQAREAEIEKLWQQEKQQPFDFERGPLLHLTLAALTPNEHILLLSLPALCADPRTLKNLARHLAAEYDAALSGAARAEEVIQYAQFAEWQNELAESEDAAAGKGHWERLRLDLRRASRLPYESGATGASSFAPESLTTNLDAETSARLAALAGRYGVSADGILLAVWQTLIHRLTGNEEVIVGQVFTGREHEALADACGTFTRCLPAIVRFTPSLSFGNVVRQLAASARAASAAQDYFEIDDYSSGGGAFFPLVFTSEEWPAAIKTQGSTFTIHDCYACGEKFSVMLNVIRAGDSLRAEFLYDPAQLRLEDVRYVADLFSTLLTSAIENPEAQADALELVNAAEQQRLLLHLNETATDFASSATIHELFEAQAARTPAALAVVAGNQNLTYRELDERANQLAHCLQRGGVKRGARVGVLAERSAETIVALLGVLKAGAAYLPLATTDPSARLRLILTEAGVDTVVSEERLAGLLAESGLRVVSLDGVGREELERESKQPVVSEAGAEDLAYVIYTSGSTGRPKGVMVQHRSVNNLAAALNKAVYAHLGRSLRICLNAPLTFDASVKQWVQLLGGHTLHILPEEVRYDAKDLLAYARRHAIDVLDCTPMQLKAMLAAGLIDADGTAPAAILVGGDALNEETWTLLAGSGTTQFYNVYGPTECTVDATVCRVGPEQKRPAIGRPLANTRCYILDNYLQPVPRGVVGELYIAGAGVARGYLGRADLTAERFIPEPFSSQPGARMYRTGDLARFLPNGQIEFCGRRDHQVKVRGFRVELGEIEATLKTHPAVRDAAVIARDDGTGEKHLVAYVAAPEAAADEELRRVLPGFLRQQLPQFMVPAAFVLLPKLPMTRHGKVDRSALPDPQPRASSAVSDAPPRNELERTVAAIWQEVLGVEKVGVHDNFFDLGGHSLLLARAYGKLREAVSGEFSLLDMFRHPTVSTLAAFLGGDEGEPMTREKIQQRTEKQHAALERQRRLMMQRSRS
ncbi:MAG: amino acid adenylation domain-containing protein [Acidobacteriota bacterium]